MDLRKLQIFVRVAQEGSFSGAGRALHMVQPAVSIAVRKLEQELGCVLLERNRKQVRLTAEGARLLSESASILEQVTNLKQTVHAMNRLLEGEVTIACPSMLATYYLPDLLSAFLAVHPGLTASVTQAGTRQIEAMLRDGAIEAGIITARSASTDSELEVLPLVNERIVLCMAPAHPWSTRREIAIQRLHQSPMILYESGYFIRQRLDELCEEHDVQPDIRMQTNFLPLIMRMVKLGMGTTVGLSIMAKGEPGIVGVPLKPRTTLTMALAKRRGRHISKANQAFLDWARQRR